MARVSPAHLAARRQQILDAARRCFIRNGFHATSMQDVLGEADLSAGAVYRYFKSKDDIIVAIATDTLGTITSAFATLAEIEPPLPLDEAFGGIFVTLEDLQRATGVGGLAVQVWGEALRSPALAERVRQNFGLILWEVLTRFVAVYQRHGLLPSDVPAEHIARTLGALVPGFVVQYTLLGDVDAAMFRNGLRALLHHPSSPTTPAHPD
jgi:AcrR family transcriptional regulator